jgi:hypothetical protein
MPAHLVNCPNSKSIDSSSGKKIFIVVFRMKNFLSQDHQKKIGFICLKQPQHRNHPRIYPRFSPVLVVRMVITRIPFIVKNFIIAERVCLSILRRYFFIFCFSLGWHSVMECEKGLAYSARDHDCVPIELANCAAKN